MADAEETPPRGRSPGVAESIHVRFDDPSPSSTASRSTSAMTSPLSADLRDILPHERDLPKFSELQESGIKGPILDDGSSESCQPFELIPSPNPDATRTKTAQYEKVGDQGVCKMQKFSLYETASRYYILGSDVMDMRHRVLKIDRTAEAGDLVIAEDEIVYTQVEATQLLNAIDDGNKGSGGMRLRNTFWGVLGFIRFTGSYYMVIVTKRSQVALIGGHYVYQVDHTELVPLTTGHNTSRFSKTDAKNAEEGRFLGILNNLDLTRSFYFSYSYDITRSLQNNIMTERSAMAEDKPYPHPEDHNSMFVWNSYLLEPAAAILKNTYDWCIPVIHGYVDQSALAVFGRNVYITVIARRSRHFAGARFLKRGANDLGHVANDVETEQIVAELSTTSLHAPGRRLFANPSITSYVQHRGSIPLYWTQDNTGVTPKPPINLNVVDPFYSAAALHFDNLFERYGAPVYVLNLVKARERTPRESKLLLEFTTAIDYLNQFLPENKKIIHKAWDMSRASKSRDQDVIGTLESIAEEIVEMTGFFHNGDGHLSIPRIQNGVARTNCIDCLDRTNAAQFVIGKRALALQLQALGIIKEPILGYDTDTVDLFTHMFHQHGDNIAIQYGGSQLVNTMETYRKINQWSSSSRDMVESFRRYYNNSFLDGQRQESYNLFLGNYVFEQGQPLLWDLQSDWHLHHTNPRSWDPKARRNYQQWFTPEFLEKRVLAPYVEQSGEKKDRPTSYFDEFWAEYYKPLSISSLQKIFTYPGKIHSSQRYINYRSVGGEGTYDFSPFKIRTELDQEVPSKKEKSKSVTILDPANTPQEEEHNADDNASIRSGVTAKRISLQRWLQPIHEDPPPAAAQSPEHVVMHGIMKESSSSTSLVEKKQKLTPLDKSKAAQWTFTQVVHESLNPSVSAHEEDDYARYIEHPHLLPLVTSNEEKDVEGEYVDYVNGVGGGIGGGWAIGAVSVIDDDIGDDIGGGGKGEEHEELEEYREFLRVAENPLTVLEEDRPKKRYKAYRKWLLGKSLFKQQPID